jgi:23S rRNA pseudouridine1911/1915/1917 synthase
MSWRKNRMAVIRRQYSYTGNKLERLDLFLVSMNPELTRTRIQRLIEAGCVLINEQIPTKTGVKLEVGDKVEMTIPEPVTTELIAEDIPLDIIYEDNHVLVINKPAGMVVHPSIGHTSGTLVHAALAHAPDMEGISGEGRPGVIHRLDKDTSGIILMAKDDRTLHYLQDQFKKRNVEKVYIALVDRHPPTPEGIIDAPIGRDPSHRQRMAIVPAEKGRLAVSEYKTLQRYLQHTLLEVHPRTGRTHQIRLHCSFIGCPIVADTIYGYRKPSLDLRRHFLHATRITVTLPGETIARTFEAALPEDLAGILEKLS